MLNRHACTMITNGIMLLATYDGDVLRLYIDGVQVKGINNLITNSSVPDDRGTYSLKVGGHTFSKNFFLGNIDEVRVWNRSLTNVEIAEGYTQGKFNTTGQMLYLPFNTTSGANALNTTSGANALNTTSGANALNTTSGANALNTTSGANALNTTSGANALNTTSGANALNTTSGIGRTNIELERQA